MYVDSHFHLMGLSVEDKYFDEEKSNDLVIQEAIDGGVSKMLAVSAGWEDWSSIKVFCDKYDEVYGTIGLHPHDAREVDVDSLSLDYFVEEIQEFGKKCIAIGECGLDYAFPEDLDKENQKRLFNFQIDLALKLKLPLMVHSRDAVEDLYPMVKSFFERGGVGALIHCYTNSVEYAQKLLDLGCYFSIGGIVTFKNGENVRDVAKLLPMDRLLVETDAPFLAPVPVRGKVNVPLNVQYVAKFLAELKGVELDDFNKQVMVNFENLFLN